MGTELTVLSWEEDDVGRRRVPLPNTSTGSIMMNKGFFTVDFCV